MEKTWGIYCKAQEDGSQFEGYASTPDIDSVGDIVLPSAFERTLSDFLERGKIIWQHDWHAPIGRPIKAEITPDGFWLRGRLSDTQLARDVKVLLKDGVINEMSIGFRYTDYERITESNWSGLGLSRQEADIAITRQGHYVRGVDLYEVSLVTRAANPKARVLVVKDEGSIENNGGLTEESIKLQIDVPAWSRQWGGW